MIKWAAIRQELLTVYTRPLYFIEMIIAPLSLTLITVVISKNSNAEDIIMNYVILISLYGVLSGTFISSSRSLEKEKYQDTLLLLFLSNVSLWKLVLNKLIANLIIAVVNLILTICIFLIFFSTKVDNIGYVLLGFVLLLVFSIFHSLILSYIFLILKSPYTVCSIISRFVILITGIVIPLSMIPKGIVILFSISGLPQIFSIVYYGLEGVGLMSVEYLVILPLILVMYIYLGLKLLANIESKFLKEGGI